MAEHVVTVSLQLRWGDMDINHHVNNVAIARLFEEARVRALPGLVDAASPTPQTDDASGAGGGLVVVRQVIEFLSSIPYSADDVTADVWLSRVGTSSFELGSTLADPGGARFAQAETALVHVDAVGSPSALPAALASVMRERLQAPVGLRRRG